jgi:hypothetical protein
MLRKLRETLLSKQPRVVLGVFHNTNELLLARAILTDFGYPKESASMTTLDPIKPVSSLSALSSLTRHLSIAKIILYLALMSVLTMAGVALSELPLAAYGRFLELLVTLALWALFFITGTLICGLIGLLLWTLLTSLIVNQGNGRSLRSAAATIQGKVALRIKARTPIDAEDIARAWSDIGGNIVGSGKAALP